MKRVIVNKKNTDMTSLRCAKPVYCKSGIVPFSISLNYAPNSLEMCI